MNERIDELAEQTSEITSNVIRNDEWLQKFGEVIVEDIIETIMFQARVHQVAREDGEVTALCRLVDIIREDFGVE